MQRRSGWAPRWCPETLAAADIAAGRVVVLGEPEASPRSYWLIAPTPQWRQAKVRAIVEFLLK